MADTSVMERHGWMFDCDVQNAEMKPDGVEISELQRIATIKTENIQMRADEELKTQAAFVEWLKANNLYNAYDSAQVMRRMMSVWLKYQTNAAKCVGCGQNWYTCLCSHDDDD